MKKIILIVTLLILPRGVLAEYPICYEREFLPENHRAYMILNSIKMEYEQIKIYALKTWEEKRSDIEVSFYEGVWSIVMTDYTLNTFSDEAFVGAFAHELGHIRINFHEKWATDQEKELGEQQTDAFAVKLVGADALFAAYLAHTGDEGLARRRVARAIKIINGN